MSLSFGRQAYRNICICNKMKICYGGTERSRIGMVGEARGPSKLLSSFKQNERAVWLCCVLQCDLFVKRNFIASSGELDVSCGWVE